MRYCLLFVVLLSTLFFGCTSEQKTQAFGQYQQAKQARLILPQIEALEVLVQFEPEQYQSTLLQAQSALEQLQQAYRYQQQGAWLRSYQLAHGSYRTFASQEAKSALLLSGKPLIPLVQVQSLMEKSYQQLPLAVFEQLRRYAEQPVEQWNVVELNVLLAKLSNSATTLARALSILTKDNRELINYHHDITRWSQHVKACHDVVVQLRDYLVNIAINESVKVLLALNDGLTQESAELLAYVEPDVAKNGLQAQFNQAYRDYYPYKEVLDNIHLSVRASADDTRQYWYSQWTEVAQATLMLEGRFDAYVASSAQRQRKLNNLMAENKVFLPQAKSLIASIEQFVDHNMTTKQLLVMLKQDKALL